MSLAAQRFLDSVVHDTLQVRARMGHRLVAGPRCNSLPVISNGALHSASSMTGMCARCQSTSACIQPSARCHTGIPASVYVPQVQKRKGSNWRQKELGYNTKDTRTVLTTEDLTIALEEVGRAVGFLASVVSACCHVMSVHPFVMKPFCGSSCKMADGFLSESPAMESLDLGSAVLVVRAALPSSPCIGKNCTGALVARAHLLRSAVCRHALARTTQALS